MTAAWPAGALHGRYRQVRPISVVWPNWKAECGEQAQRKGRARLLRLEQGTSAAQGAGSARPYLSLFEGQHQIDPSTDLSVRRC